jgi:hypothetical protein
MAYICLSINRSTSRRPNGISLRGGTCVFAPVEYSLLWLKRQIRHALQKSLNRVGDSSVYLTVC